MAGPTLPGPFPPAFPARAPLPHREMPTSSLRPHTRPSCSKSRSGAVLPSKRCCGTDQVTSHQTPTAAAAAASAVDALLCCRTAAFQGFVSGSQPRSPSSIVGHNNCRCGTSPTPQTNASKSTRLPVYPGSPSSAHPLACAHPRYNYPPGHLK